MFIARGESLLGVMVRAVRVGVTMILSLGSALCAWAAEQPAYRWDHKPGAQLSLVAGDKVLWTYHFAKTDNTPYCHPVATPDGTALTAFAPADHAWHRPVAGSALTCVGRRRAREAPFAGDFGAV